ncbi:MAG TPA: hypothetical protein VKB54_12030 [Solirubrobacteraceae bacterium]|nr:hypothetical protein [Solirubrobacteraceae bacterium]
MEATAQLAALGSALQRRLNDGLVSGGASQEVPEVPEGPEVPGWVGRLGVPATRRLRMILEQRARLQAEESEVLAIALGALGVRVGPGERVHYDASQENAPFALLGPDDRPA